MTSNSLATIWYADDGYSVANRSINGRRMAGQSFLRGYLKNTDANILRASTFNEGEAARFTKLAEEYAKDKQIDAFNVTNLEKLAQTDVLYYSGPSLNEEAWRRYRLGQKAYSICGITHTTATRAVMEQVFNYSVAPVEEWDGLICTSTSVKASIDYQLELSEEYFKKRMGVKKLTIPKISVIPLGIECDDFYADAQTRSDFFEKHSLGEDTHFVISIISRLSLFEKFDPVTFFLAVNEATKRTKRKIVIVLCGIFPDENSKSLFNDAANQLLKSTKVIIIDGSRHINRTRALSAADAFAFPIDNVQETFGLSPIEGMAAGVPVITTDWNGMKDTVTKDVGIRVPTRMASGESSGFRAHKFRTNFDNYTQYLVQQSAVTAYDIGAMAQAIADLANNPDKCKTMGKAAKKRAYELYDWSVVIPQMQEFWNELTKIREKATKAKDTVYKGLDMPIAPRPNKFFAAYPTIQGFKDKDKFAVVEGSDQTMVQQMFNLRKYPVIKRMVLSVNSLEKIYAALEKPITYQKLKSQALVGSDEDLENGVIWLLKFNLIEIVK